MEISEENYFIDESTRICLREIDQISSIPIDSTICFQFKDLLCASKVSYLFKWKLAENES